MATISLYGWGRRFSLLRPTAATSSPSFVRRRGVGVHSCSSGLTDLSQMFHVCLSKLVIHSNIVLFYFFLIFFFFAFEALSTV